MSLTIITTIRLHHTTHTQAIVTIAHSHPITTAPSTMEVEAHIRTMQCPTTTHTTIVRLNPTTTLAINTTAHPHLPTTTAHLPTTVDTHTKLSHTTIHTTTAELNHTTTHPTFTAHRNHLTAHTAQ